MTQKILVVEDMQVILKLLMSLLKKEGYEVHGVQDGKEAYKMAKVMSFDLILCDLQLPGIDGVKLIGLLKDEDRVKDTPIIVISSTAPQASRVDQSLIAAYLIKPVQPGVIIQKVREALPEVQAELEDESKAILQNMDARSSQRQTGKTKVIEGFPVEPVLVSDLAVGMVTGDQIFDKNNLPIIPMGVELTEKYIEKLRQIEVEEVLIRK